MAQAQAQVDQREAILKCNIRVEITGSEDFIGVVVVQNCACLKEISQWQGVIEVQVECKKDGNGDIYKGIPNQLIERYMKPELPSGVQFGIYLIFYFREKNKKEEFLEKVEKTISEEYSEKIRIVCIDLTR